MENFKYSIQTKIYFGEGEICHLGEEVHNYGKNVLLVYGGGSIKCSGLYDEVLKQMSHFNLSVVELSGIDPNPRIESVREGVNLCREHNIDVVLAVGGGSTIDCAKVIAASVSYVGDAWDIVLDPSKVVSVLPIIDVLTLSATGTEMDPFAVISDLTINDKLGVAHDDMRPVVSILDPSYTCSVSAYQTAAGTADIMSHICESYFSNVKGSFMQDRMAEGLLKTCVEYGVKAIADPNSYEARANLMWTSSWAINGFISLGKNVSWTVHPMEHELSAYYDITHGVGLAILTPHWMRAVLSESTVDRFVEYAVNVWNIEKSEDKFAMAEKAIQATADYFKAMNIPSTLREVKIDEEYFDVMSEKAAKHLKGAYVELSPTQIKAIYQAAL